MSSSAAEHRFRQSQRPFDSGLPRSATALLVLVAIGLALAAGGCFGGDDEEQEAAPGRPPPRLRDTTGVEGGPPRERALLQRVVRGMERTTLTRVVIGEPEASSDPDGGAAVAISFTTVRGGSSVRSQWEGWIVAGAFSRRLQAAGLPARVDASDRSGSFMARPRLRGQPDPRRLSRRREAAVVRGIRKAAGRSGGEVVRLEVHRPYGAAVAVSLAAENPAAFLKDKLRPFLESLNAQRPQLEGIYLAVLDGRRRLAVEWGSWTRNPAGSYWVRRDLANCSPIRQSEPPGAKPPPACPA